MNISKNKNYSRKYFFLLIIVGFVYIVLQQFRENKMMSSYQIKDYEEALLKYASTDKTIFLCQVDEAFADMAINFYQTSFLPHGITNVLFLGASSKSCKILSDHSIPCYNFTEDRKGGVASPFNSEEFKRKTNMRADMILKALGFGFTVIHSDADVYFFKNPLPILMAHLESNDIAVLWDVSSYNSGFLAIKPSKNSIYVYKRLIEITLTSHENDQINLDRAMNEFFKKGLLKVKKLDIKKFICGLYYYETGLRYFAKPCEDCVVLHNNWIMSKEAKVYRFKEHMMWKIDEDGYYSSPINSYITFSYPTFNYNQKINLQGGETQMNILKTALMLSRMLNRKLILPRFTCYTENQMYECPLNSYLTITNFDKAFNGEYRESSFLENPLVPVDLIIKKSKEIAFSFENKNLFDLNSTKNFKIESNSIYLIDISKEKVLFDSDITEALGSMQERVLVFKSLEGVNLEFSDDKAKEKFSTDVSSGFKQATYRQI